MPKVTFISIAYNEAAHLPLLLKSLVEQDYPHSNIQVILVNSASTDRTKNIMLEFAANNDFDSCIVLENPKRVLASGWNVALAEAKGEIIVKVDAHGSMCKGFLSDAVREIDSGEDIVGGQRVTVFDCTSGQSRMLAHAECSIFGSGVAGYRRNIGRKYVKTLAHAAYSKKVFDTVGGFNELLRRTEDNEIHWRMRQAGFKICQVPEMCSYLYARSTMRTMIRQKHGNGYWIGVTFPKCPKCLSLYNFIPMFFVLGIAAMTILSFIIGSWLPIGLLMLAYFSCAFIASFYEMRRESKKSFRPVLLMLPAVFFIMHVVYGASTIQGLFASPFIGPTKTEKNNGLQT